MAPKTIRSHTYPNNSNASRQSRVMAFTADQALSCLDSYFRDTIGLNDYHRHRERYRSDAQMVESLANDGPLLEIGSVPCHTTALLKLMGIDVHGVDLRPERCQAIIEHFELNVTRCDIEQQSLPFPDQHFPVVLFAETLEHLRIDPLFVLSEINRILPFGGILLLTTPNFYSAQNVARFLLGRGITDAYTEFSKLRLVGHMGHVREYTPREVCRFLQVSGFEIELTDFKHYHYPRTRRGFAARVIFAVLPRRFRSYQIVVARKIASSPGLRPLA